MIVVANGNTYIIDRPRGEKLATLIPVLAYVYVQGNVAFPICAMAHGGLTRGRALVTPDGFVTDPSYGIVCATIEEWMKLTNSPAYWDAPEKQKKLAAVQPPAEPTAEGLNMDSKAREPAKTPTAKAEPQTQRLPDKPLGKPQKFQTTSFWRSTNADAIFKVEGDHDAPPKNDARFEKIKRDEWQALKKAGHLVTEYATASQPARTSKTRVDDDDLI